MATQAEQRSTVDPAKWLAIVRRWCPAAPVEFPIALVNSLIEAAATGPAAQLRLGLLDELVLGLDAQLCSLPQKKNKLKMWTARMANDTLRRPELRPGHAAELARAALAAVERSKDQVLSVEKIHTALRRVKPKIRPTSTYALVKRMTDCGWFERVDAGVYGVPSRAREPYEPMTIKLLRLVYTAPDHEMGTRQALAVLDWTPKLLSATASELCSRNLLKSKKGVLLVPQEIVEKLARGEGVLIAPGKVLYARAGGPPIDYSAFTTLRAERPRVGREALAQKIAWLRTLKGEPLKIALPATAKELAWDPADLAAQLPKATQRYLRKEAARERFREEVTPLMEKYPKRSLKPLRALFKEACERIDGLTREICEYVIDEVAEALLREKGLKTSWREPGAPIRG